MKLISVFSTAIVLNFTNSLATSFHKYSPNMKIFFNSVLSRCTTDIHLETNNSNSVSHLEGLMNYFGEVPYNPTFSVQQLNNSYINELQKQMDNTSMDRGKKPIWIFKKYSFCNAQLYLFDAYDTMNVILSYFVHSVMTKLDPKIVILWDTTINAKYQFSDLFEREEFYFSFTDYRIYIGRLAIESVYSAELICVPCFVAKHFSSRRQFTTPIGSDVDSEKSLHFAWKKLHKNAQLPISFACKAREGFCVNEQLIFVIVEKLNTSVQLSGSIDFESYVSILDDSFPLNTRNVENVFVTGVWPGFHIVGSSIQNNHIIITTVVPNVLLRTNGLSALFSSFQHNVWCLFTMLLVTVIILLHVYGTYSVLNNIWLWVFGPMTDHWSELKENWFVVRIVLLWSILSWSLTILYGGELTTALAVLKPPKFPNTLEELSANVVALNGVGHGNVMFSFVAAELHERAKRILQNPTGFQANFKTKNLNATASIADRLNRNLCLGYRTLFAAKPKKRPFKCDYQKLKITFKRPLSFLSSERQSKRIKWAFTSSNQFWVSPFTSLAMIRKTTAVVFTNNYVVKLAEPIVTSYLTHGLDKRWSRRFSDVQLPDDTGRRHRIPSSADAKSNVNEQSAETITSIGSIAMLFYVLVAMAAVMLLVEFILKVLT